MTTRITDRAFRLFLGFIYLFLGFMYSVAALWFTATIVDYREFGGLFDLAFWLAVIFLYAGGTLLFMGWRREE